MFLSHTTPRSVFACALALFAALAIGAAATLTSHALAADGTASGAGTVAEVPELPFEDNPVLDDWFVRWEGPEGTVDGWAPDPFVRRDG